MKPRITILVELGPEPGKVGHQHWSVEIPLNLMDRDRDVAILKALDRMLEMCKEIPDEPNHS